MIGRLMARLSGALAGVGHVPESAPDWEALARHYKALQAAAFGPYFRVSDMDLKILSVFDDLKYDRADADMMSPAMRTHAVAKLKPLGYRQTSGTRLEQAETGIRVLIPKSHALGASPFDITRYTPKRSQDFYLLTPTQTACQFIDTYHHAEAVTRIKALVQVQPINLYRLMDFLEKKPSHEAFRRAIGHLKYVQREAVTSEPLMRRRALR